MSDLSRDRLDGRRALVTGGSKGAGKAVVERLRELGADVWTSARTMPDGYEHPDRFIAADTSTAEGAATVAARIAETGGALDVLVHVVGGSSTPTGGFAVITDESWVTELQFNLLGAVRATDLPGLPPTFVDVGSAATFRDEDVAFAVRLWRAGARAELHVWPGGFHGFDVVAPHATLSRDAVAARAAWLHSQLDG